MMVIEVSLNSRKHPGHVALIDDADAHIAECRRWSVSVRPLANYAMANIGGRVQTMHTYLLGNPDRDIDHINGNGLDNRRSNLRLATESQNMANRGKQRNNTSGFKGVHWSQKHGKWKAEICCNRHRQHLGLFIDPVEAAHAYDSKARELFGEFARLNFPREGEQQA